MSDSKYLKAFLFAIILIVFFPLYTWSESVKTPAESSDYSQYSQYEKISEFLSRLDHLSQELAILVIGQTKETRRYPSKDIYLCVICEEGADYPHELNRSKPTFLLIASQHGNEQSAKEAALWLIRDLTVGELKPMLKKVNFLVIPQANPYGNRFDQRQNEQDLDLNRDHVKIEAPEVEAIHNVFRTWMPEVTMDVHEKGDDYYRVSIGCVSNVNIHSSLQEFSRHTILAEVEKKLRKKNITFHEYLITQPMGIDSSAGVRYREEDLESREMMKRYSTTDLNDGRNSLGIYETLSFIQEGASRHDLETLKERTRWQYYGIMSFAESIVSHGEEIISKVRDLREKLMEKARFFSDDDLVHLRMEYARNTNEPELTIQKFERTEAPIIGILKVDKKEGEPVTFEDVAAYPFPREYKVTTEVVKNWFPNVDPIISVPRPLGYIIPAQHLDVVETLLRHNIKVEVFIKDAVLGVESYEVKAVIPARYDYLPPQEIEVDKKTIQIVIKQGDFYISCTQPGANLIPCLLEPQTQYGFIRYQKFKLVPEVGDLFAFYRYVGKEILPVIPYKNWKR